MRQFRLYGVIVSLGLFTGVSTLVGCGQAHKQDSPYSGTYRAAYEIPALSESGVFSYTVAQKGDMTGSFVDNNSGKTFGFTGGIGNDGNFNGTVSDGTNKFPISGAYRTSNNQSGGNFQETRNGTPVQGSFVVADIPITTPSPTPSNPFQNSYRGTYDIPERSESGNISFTVGPKGELIGFISQTANQPVGSLSGTVDNNGVFNCTVSYPTGNPDPYKTSRAFNGRIAKSTTTPDAGNAAGDFTMNITTQSATATTPPVSQVVSGNFQLTVGGSEAFSQFKGSYDSGLPVSFFWNQPTNIPNLPQQGPAIFTIDQEGELIGTWNEVIVKLRITNDLRFVGTFGGYQITGKISKQGVPKLDPQTGKSVTSPGVAGNFVITYQGVDYVGTFFGAGGFTN